MNCRQVYGILETLKQGKNPAFDEKAIDYLQNRPLILLMSEEDYSAAKQKEAELERLREQLDSQGKAVLFTSGKLGEHRKVKPNGIFSSKAKESYDKIEFALEKRLKDERDKFELAQIEHNRVKEVCDEIIGYAGTAHGYVKVTSLGERRIVELKARLYRLADQEFELLEKEMKETNTRLEQRFNRWQTLYAMVRANKSCLDGENLRAAFATLSQREADGEQNLVRFKSMQREFDRQGFYSENGGLGYKTYALMALEEGSPEEIVSRVDMAHKIALKNFNPGPGTTDLAAMIARNTTVQTLPTKLDRFSELYYRLPNIENIHSRGTAAAIMAESEETEARLVEKFDSVHQRLCIIAQSSTLLPSLVEAAARFSRFGEEEFKKLVPAYIHTKDRVAGLYGYSIAVELALKPGNINEICDIFDLTVEKAWQCAEIPAVEKYSISAQLMSSAWKLAELQMAK